MAIMWTSAWYPETVQPETVQRAGNHWLAAKMATTGYLCTHDALKGKDGQCPDCGSSVIYWHNLGKTRDGGYISNPYGTIDPNPPKPSRDYTSHEIEQGRAVADAINVDRDGR